MDTAQQSLIKTYEQAIKKLQEAIARREKNGGSASEYQKKLRKRLLRILEDLKKETPELTRQMLTAAANDSALQCLRQLQTELTYTLQPRVNPRTLSVLSQNMTDQLIGAVNRVGRQYNDAIRTAAMQAAHVKLSSGQTVEAMRRMLLEKLQIASPGGVAMKNGKMRLDAYAAMVARSTNNEIRNTVKLDMAREHGVDLVMFTSHTPTCALCAGYENRVFALTDEAAGGKYKGPGGEPLRFPKLFDTAFAHGYKNIHPNCRHGLVLIPAALRSAEWLKTMSEQSVKPFVDTRSAAVRQAYAKAQAENRARSADRRQWEAYRARLPEQTPKTFAAFRQMKRAGGQKWTDLQADFKYLVKISDGYKKVAVRSSALAANQPISQKSISIINKAGKRFAKDFPLVDRWMSPPIFTPMASDEPAETVVNIHSNGLVLNFGIEYNANMWYDHHIIKNMVMQQADGRHIQTDNPAAVSYHELGHMAHNALAFKLSGCIPVGNLSPEQCASFRTERKLIAQHMYLLCFSDESFDEIIQIIKTELSERASESGNELIAECFAQYYTGNPGRIAKTVVAYFKKELTI